MLLSRRKFFIGGTSAIISGAIMEKAMGNHHKHVSHVIPATKPIHNNVIVKQSNNEIVSHGHKHHHSKPKYPKFTHHKKVNIKLTKFDKNVLVKTIWGETRGETDLGRAAVVHVILNRKYKQNPFFKNKTISQLCLKKYQFSCWLDKWKMNHIKIDDTYNDIKKLVNDAIVKYEQGIDYSNGALFYYSDIMDKPPAWAKDYEQVNKIGLHNFFA